MADEAFERLISARLILGRFRADDVAAFAAYRADPAVARYQSWENFTRADGEAFVAEMAALHPDMPGCWFQFAIELAATGETIGDCALYGPADAPADAEIGFTLAAAHHGRGYATESVGCLLDYAFDRLRKDRVVAITDVRNVASIAVLERLGFGRDPAPREPVRFKGEVCQEYLYEMRRRDWTASRR